MVNKHKVTAIIAAAGNSSRIGFPKLLHNINSERSVLSLSIEAICKNEYITDVVVVTKNEFFDFVKKECEKYCFDKPYKITRGGSSRQESVRNGVLACDNDTDFFAIHDGARPFVTNEEISAVINDAFKYDCAILGVPVKDTLKVVENGIIVSTPNRESVFAAHTPQVFKADIYKKAIEDKALDTFTDDAAIVESVGSKVHLTLGKYSNKKITTIEDLL
jgi:2-C-methyl-D-erythritol 4-phosphate cytidylyltransferase